MMKKLRLVKRGFEEISATPTESKPLSRTERKAAREARKLKKTQK
jgi:hypothetical protein